MMNDAGVKVKLKEPEKLKELDEILEFLEHKGYTIEKDVSKKYNKFEEVEIYANAVACANNLRYIMVRREENERPLIPLERFMVAVARLLGVKGFAIATNGSEVEVLRVSDGEHFELKDIPDAKDAKPFEFKFDEEKELRIAIAIGKLRCPCKCDECRL